MLNHRENDSHRAPSRDGRQPLYYQGLVLEASGIEWQGEIQQTAEYTRVDCEASSSVPIEDIGEEISGENREQNNNGTRSHVNVMIQSNNENKPLSTNTKNAVRTHHSSIYIAPSEQSLQSQQADNAGMTARSPSQELFVHELRTPSVLLLLTTLRDRRSDATSFRRAAGRIIMILIEEVLGQFDTCAVEVVTSSGHVTTGIEQKYVVCGVQLCDEGYPFSVLFHQVEVDAAEGYIHVNSVVDQRGCRYWLLDRMDVPASIPSCKVLLFTATTSNGGRECKAIEALISVGTLEKNITLVTIVCASDGIVAVCSRFPRK